MAKFLSIQEAMNKGKGKVSVRGWVWRERGSSKFKFIVLRDASDVIQCVINCKSVGDELFTIADKIEVETSMEITGDIKADKRAPTGYEIQVKDFKVIGDSHEFPITKDQSIEFLADNRHLWLRSRKMSAVLKVRSTVFGAIHEYFRLNGFYEFQSPCFTPNACEGGSTLFTCDYFGKPMFLTQSWQLYAEAGIFSLGNMYTIAPSFRAERSKTSRHLTEYWHAEMEMAWADFDEMLKHAEELIKHIVKKVLETNKPELELLERNIKELEPVVKKPFIKMTYKEALKILKQKCRMAVPYGKDLRTVEEQKLTSLYDVPVIVTHYPKEIKAFYMLEDSKDKSLVLGTDILVPIVGELVGGSERESNPDKLNKRLKQTGENPEIYGWYLDLRKYGSVPHSGFGLGVERAIQWICGLDSIKDTIPFPRTMTRYYP